MTGSQRRFAKGLVCSQAGRLAATAHNAQYPHKPPTPHACGFPGHSLSHLLSHSLPTHHTPIPPCRPPTAAPRAHPPAGRRRCAPCRWWAPLWRGRHQSPLCPPGPPRRKCTSDQTSGGSACPAHTHTPAYSPMTDDRNGFGRRTGPSPKPISSSCSRFASMQAQQSCSAAQ